MIISKNKTSNIAMELVSLALAGRELDEIPYSDEEMKAVYEYAKSAGIGSITYAAIENCLDEDKAFDEDSFYFEWKKLRLNSYRRNMLFEKEKDNILQGFDEKGIWYMPLKGTIVKNFYPKPDLREMNDIDILIDSSKRDEIAHFMKSIGYKKWNHSYHKDPESVNGEITPGENSDDYTKEPFFYFEMHKYLIEDSISPFLAKYYENVKDMLVKDEDNKCGYHFTDEDFYIYLFVHAHKHFAKNGIGPRFLIDAYVYLNSHHDLDQEYIAKVFSDAGITEFEKDVKGICTKAFDLDSEIDMESLTKSQQILYDSVMGAGVFGNLETRWKNQVYELDPTGEASKNKYFKSRLFPDEQWYRLYHPFVYKHKIVKPFFTVYRLTVLAFRGRKTVKKEIDQVGGKDA